MTDIFVIAEEELVIAFKMAGVEGEAVSTREEALAAFRKATGAASARVLALGEDVADMLGDELLAWQLKGEYPLVTEIPPLAGSKPGRPKMVDAVRRAVGISI